MGTIYTNHTTVIGFRHTLKHTPCEDASDSGYNPEQDRAFAAVADGHGASIYARSKEGSAFAVESAKCIFKNFADTHTAEELDTCFADEASEQETMHQIIDDILSQWRARVAKHLSENELRDEEVAHMPEKYAEVFRAGKYLIKLYGTTLIAALRTGNWLIMVHQGDGRCAALYEDGSMDQPVPWDEGCRGNITTSLCDTDARERFRWQVIDLRKTPVMMLFLSTDGVEDSFPEMEDSYMLYQQLACFLSESPQKYEKNLADLLPDLTKAGSKDDISVSVIADTEQLKAIAPVLTRQVDRYIAETRLKKLREDLSHKKNFLDRLLNGVIKTQDALINALMDATNGETVPNRQKYEALLRSDHPDVYEAADIFCDAKLAYDSHRPEYAATAAALREAEESLASMTETEA